MAAVFNNVSRRIALAESRRYNQTAHHGKPHLPAMRMAGDREIHSVGYFGKHIRIVCQSENGACGASSTFQCAADITVTHLEVTDPSEPHHAIRRLHLNRPVFENLDA